MLISPSISDFCLNFAQAQALGTTLGRDPWLLWSILGPQFLRSLLHPELRGAPLLTPLYLLELTCDFLIHSLSLCVLGNLIL